MDFDIFSRETQNRIPSLSKQFLEEFIEVYKTQPSLWKSRSDQYKDKNLRSNSWEILVEKFKEVDKNATIETVKKKINALKVSYRRELLKVIRSEKSGAGEDDVYVPSLWYFDNLNFLRDQEEQAEGLSTLGSARNMDMTAKRKRSNNVEEDFLRKATEYMQNDSNQSDRDDAKIFGEGWAAIFRKLDGRQQIFAKRIIDDALLRGQLGHLTEMSGISYNVNQQPENFMSHRNSQLICQQPIYIRPRGHSSQFSSSTSHSELLYSPDSNSTSFDMSSVPSPANDQQGNIHFISDEVVRNPFQELFDSQEYQ